MEYISFHATSDKYEYSGKTVQSLSTTIELLNTLILNKAQQDDVYKSSVIVDMLKVLLNLSVSKGVLGTLILLTTRLCHKHKIESNLVIHLENYLISHGVDINRLLNWEKIFIQKIHPNRPTYIMPRRPRSPSLLFKDEAFVFIQVMVWYKLSRSRKRHLDLNNSISDVELYWAANFNEEFELAAKILSMESPWKRSKTCSYEKFIDALKYRYNGVAPSEPWLYKNISNDGSYGKVLRKRQFTRDDYLQVINKIAKSSGFSKRFKGIPNDILLVEEMRNAATAQ